MNIFVITGPSGVGKTYLITELVARGLHSLAVYTDRRRRPTESGTTDRIYLSKNQFTESIGKYIYWFEFQGFRYGYRKSEIEEASETDTSIVLSIPLSQLPGLIKKIPEIIIIFLNIETGRDGILRKRMIKRDISESDTDEIREEKIRQIEKRIQFYKKESTLLDTNDFSFLNNNKHKQFIIKDERTLYDEVIPYIMQIYNPPPMIVI